MATTTTTMTSTSNSHSNNSNSKPSPSILSTRVCIKNLPISFDEKQLQAFLIKESSKGNTANTASSSLVVTDCKVLRRSSDQKSRQLAFVGFASQEQATHVVHHFHQTYCRTSRLSVEYALAKSATATSDNNNNTNANTNTNAHRPWSKHSKGSSKYQLLHGTPPTTTTATNENDKKKKGKELGSKKTIMTKEERRKQEFMEAMGVGTTKTKFWANDDGAMGMDIVDDTTTTTPTTTTAKSKQQQDDDDDDDASSSSVASDDDSGGEGADSLKAATTTVTTTTTIKNRAIQGSVTTDLDFLRSKATIKDELESDDEEQQQEQVVAMKDTTQAITTAAADDDNDIDDNASVSSSSSSSWPSDSSNDSHDDDNDDDNDKEKVTSKTESATTPSSTVKPNVSQPSNNSSNNDDDDNLKDLTIVNDEQHNTLARDRLFVRNLPFSTTEEELRHHFTSTAGAAAATSILECHIPVDDQKRNKGFAFVTFASPDQTARAMDALDGTDFQGRLLHLLPARKSNSTEQMDPNDPSLSYKQKQDLLRRQTAMDASKQGWSASFVRGDAVVDNLAQRLGLRKSDILNVKGLSSGDAAVRLALGETQIIEENRQYFSNHGIDMEALVSTGTTAAAAKTKNDKTASGELKRSTTAILVKNLPFETEKDELSKLFGEAPERILLPPSRTIALVEYGHSSDAKRAFKKLAYKRFKHVPLYLEWAPLIAISSKLEGDMDGKRISPPSGQDQTTVGTQQKDQTMETEDADPNASFSIYIKNLNFITTEEQLRATFEKHVPVRAVKIPLKAAPIKRGEEESTKFLAMGFGFVECDSDASVRKAIKTLQGTVLDGHALELKRSSKPLAGTNNSKTPKPAKGTNPTKIMCRNVPFQATRKEILQLFGSFGQLKKVRLPRKFDGQHRGFAFCEFLTSQEAQSAMTALSRTHLYGRHLVLEWADDDQEDIDLLRDKAKRDLAPSSQHAKAKQQQPLNKKIKFNFD